MATTTTTAVAKAALLKNFSAEVLEEDDGSDEEDCFFESLDRVPSSVSVDFCDLASSGTDSDADDPRISFASAVGGPLDFRRSSLPHSPSATSPSSADPSPREDYHVWISEPLSIEERRCRLLQGMGLASGRDLASRRRNDAVVAAADRPPPAAAATFSSTDAAAASPPGPPSPASIVRSKSDAGAADESARVRRLVRLLGTPSPPRTLVRATSMPPCVSLSPRAVGGDGGQGRTTSTWREGGHLITNRGGGASIGNSAVSSFCTIKDLDTGKEFVIDDLLGDGAWNRLSDPRTGLRLTIEEFEKSLGYSPIVRELMRRANIGSGAVAATVSGINGADRHSRGRKSSIKSVKKGIGWLKNIKGVASSVTALMLEREREVGASGRCASFASAAAGTSSTEWMKVRQCRKPCKELTGLYLCQAIKAHQGSIWTIKFNPDGQLLASAGEDSIIHVWQVNDCDAGAASFRRPPEEANAASLVSCSQDLSALLLPTDPHGLLDARQSQRLSRRIISNRKRSTVPEHIVPGAVFSLSNDPICSFRGHLDDVLDLSWSKSQYLLSSSMDKTVRLWDLESKACVKLFAHNDYVTCIQFNPLDDRYFISGSLDAKVRIWSIPDRQVVDWTDLHEMVTAACYTPDGQGALVGSHKGSCCFYSTSEGKLHRKTQIHIQNKKRKSHAKKITGFQFAPENPSEVLITSADSQIRVFDGVNLIHKFRGFRNTSSQISASFTADGNYVVCASEDSHVYIWKREESHSAGSTGKGKSWITTRSYEHFQCKDVSVAIPWPPNNSSKQGSRDRALELGWLSSNRIESQPDSADPLNHGSKIDCPHLSSCSRQHNCQSSQRSPGSEKLPSPMITVSEDVFTSCRSQCPPLPKKTAAEQSPEEELSNSSYSSSGIGCSSSLSTSNWLTSGALSSITAFNTFTSSTSSSRGYNGGGYRNSNIPASTAWGLVVVTAGLGGEIKVYQNFGLPRLLSRQNLF